MEKFNKKKLFLAILKYLNLELKYFIFKKYSKSNIFEEKIFDFKVKFFNYKSLIFMFKEIFIKRVYYFNTETDQPFIIDCGSNIGIALIFFKKLYPDSKIIAFEPDNKTFEILKQNVEMNNLKDVELFNKAVHNYEGIINFYYDPEHLGALNMSVKKERLPRTYRKVQSVLLSNFIEENVDFLKLDIEGNEELVIEELSKANKLKLVKEMVIEYHHHLEPKEDRFSTILKIIEENNFGYQISTSFRNPFSKKKFQDRERFQDILIYAYQK